MGGSVEQLRETLGATNVHRSILQAEEGLGDFPGVVIFGGQPEAEVSRTLDEERAVSTCGQRPPCRWRIAGGIPWSMTVAAAQNLNGRPFQFNGFAFDLGGIVTSWKGGRMENLLGHARVGVGCDGDYPKRM